MHGESIIQVNRVMHTTFKSDIHVLNLSVDAVSRAYVTDCKWHGMHGLVWELSTIIQEQLKVWKH